MDPLTLVIILLVVLWLGGFSLGAGSAVHLLLVVLLVVVLIRVLQGRSL